LSTARTPCSPPLFGGEVGAPGDRAQSYAAAEPAQAQQADVLPCRPMPIDSCHVGRGGGGVAGSGLPMAQAVTAAPSHEERREIASAGELLHLLVSRSLIEPLCRVEEPRKYLDVAGREEERVGTAEHPMRRKVDVRLLT